MAYRSNGFAAKAIEHLQTLEPGTCLSSAELADAIGCGRQSLSACLKAARLGGDLHAEKDGKDYVWSLPPEVGEPEFNAALWADGDLVIYGAQANSDGSVTLTADQVATVKRLISWSPAP